MSDSTNVDGCPVDIQGMNNVSGWVGQKSAFPPAARCLFS